MPLFKELPMVAYSSLAANSERHPKVLQTCEILYHKDESLTPPEKEELYDLLSEFFPKKYPPKKDKDQEA